MEVRCQGCNKLFRVSDDKITGSGIKFACTKCAQHVKITREDLEHYKSSAAASRPVVPPQTKPVSPSLETAIRQGSGAVAAAPAPEPDLGAALPSFMHEEPTRSSALDEPVVPPPPAHAGSSGDGDLAKALPAFLNEAPAKPVAHGETPEKKAAQPVSRPAPKTEPVAKTAEPKAPPAQKRPDAIKTDAAPKPQTQSASPEVRTVIRPPEPASVPSPPTTRVSETKAPEPAPRSLEPAASSGTGKKLLVLVVVLILVSGAAFGAKWYLDNRAPQAPVEAPKSTLLPDGLRIVNPTGAMDGVSGDLIIAGVVENTTDKPKPAWYVVIDVYDAQNSIIAKAKVLNGKQLYTRRDYDILSKRGVNVQDLIQKSLQDQGMVIPANGNAGFEIHLMEPPVGVASFNATLQPFDPVQLFKEIAEEQKTTGK